MIKRRGRLAFSLSPACLWRCCVFCVMSVTVFAVITVGLHLKNIRIPRGRKHRLLNRSRTRYVFALVIASCVSKPLRTKVDRNCEERDLWAVNLTSRSSRTTKDLQAHIDSWWCFHVCGMWTCSREGSYATVHMIFFLALGNIHRVLIWNEQR